MLPHERRQVLGPEPVQRQATPLARVTHTAAVAPGVSRPLLPHERRAMAGSPVVLPALATRNRSQTLPARLDGLASRGSVPADQISTQSRALQQLGRRVLAQASGKLLDLGVAMIDAAGAHEKATPAEIARGDHVPAYRGYMHGTLLDVLETARYGRSLDPHAPKADEPAYRKFMGGTLVDLFEKAQSERRNAIEPESPRGDGSGGEAGDHARAKPSRLRQAMSGTLVDLFDKMTERKVAAEDGVKGKTEQRRLSLSEPKPDRVNDSGSERRMTEVRPRTSSEQSHKTQSQSERSKRSSNDGE